MSCPCSTRPRTPRRATSTVTVTASEKEYVPVRGAVLKFYDAALFTFEKANQN